MAMPIQSIALLLAEHKRDAFEGPVLTYGMQGINVSMAGAQWLCDNSTNHGFIRISPTLDHD